MSEQRPTTWFSGKSNPNGQPGGTAWGKIAGIGAFIALSPIGALVAALCWIAFQVGRISYKVIGAVAVAYLLLLIPTGQLSAAGVANYMQPWSQLRAQLTPPNINNPDPAGSSTPGEPSSAPSGNDNTKDRGKNKTPAPSAPSSDSSKDNDTSTSGSNNPDPAGGGTGGSPGEFTISGLLAAQTPLGILIGLLIGTTLTWWRWKRRPSWEDHTLRPTPWEWWRARRTAAAIAAGANPPDDGVTLGLGPDGRRIVQTDAEAAAHSLLLGAAGSGKTSTLMVRARDVVRRGHGLVVIDLKGAADVPAAVADLAARYGRPFLHFAIQDSRAPYDGPASGPAYYDPAGRGDPSRRKDLLIGAKKWDVDYYKQIVGAYLQTAFRVAAVIPPAEGVGSFEDLVDLLQPHRLAERAQRIPIDYPQRTELLAEVHRLTDGAEAQEKSGIRSMQAYLQTFVASTAGAWLRRDPDGQRDIDLRRVADEGWVVCFSLDSSNYEESSAAIAGLIVQDLKTLSSELRANPAPDPLHIYIDEFQAIGSDNIIGLINRCRDARMPVTLATQARGDLLKVDAAFLDQVVGIVNCFLIHRANSEEDAELYAGLTGREKKFKKVIRVEHKSSIPGGSFGVGAAQGTGMIEEYDEYRVLPHQIQSLQPGHMVYVAKSPQIRVIHPVRVIRENLAAGMQHTPVAVPATTHPAPTGDAIPPVPVDVDDDAWVWVAEHEQDSVPHTAPAAMPAHPGAAGDMAAAIDAIAATRPSHLHTAPRARPIDTVPVPDPLDPEHPHDSTPVPLPETAPAPRTNEAEPLTGTQAAVPVPVPPVSARLVPVTPPPAPATPRSGRRTLPSAPPPKSPPTGP